MDALRKAEQEKREAAKRLREKQQTGASDSDKPSEPTFSLEPVSDGDQTQTFQDAGNESPAVDEPATFAKAGPSGAGLTLTPLEHSESLPAGQQDNADDAQQASMAGGDTLIDITAGDLEADQHIAADIDPGGEQSVADSNDGHADLELETTGSITRDPEDARQDLLATSEHPAAQPDLDRSQDTGTQNLRPDIEPTLNATVGKPRGRSSRLAINPAGDNDSSNTSPLHYDKTDTRATAQHVFAARKSASPATLTVVFLAGLIMVGLAAAGVFYYYSVTPTVHEFVSPRVVEEVDSPAAVEEKIELPQLPEEDLASTAANAATRPVQPIALPVTEVATDTDLAATSAQSPSQQVPSQSASSSSAAQAQTQQTVMSDAATVETSAPDTREESDQNIKQDSNQNLGQSAAEANFDKALELKPALLKISKTQATGEVGRAVSEAYAAYRNGDLATAQALYQAVLRNNRNNRNALLGLGAIAVQQQRFDAAYHYYAAILKQNPADTVAQTALLSMQQQTDPVASESHLKQMLADQPEAAYLYQALGHVYARTQRWPQAQQAYFDAYHRNSKNPDYAYNLAVSLDHLGQGKAALDYYVRALELATTDSFGFSRQAAQSRIAQLRQTQLSQGRAVP